MSPMRAMTKENARITKVRELETITILERTRMEKVVRFAPIVASLVILLIHAIKSMGILLNKKRFVNCTTSDDKD